MEARRRAPDRILGRVALNGRIVPLSRAQVSVTEGAFLHGEGVFETLRLYGGRPLFLRPHRARLAAGARALGLACPPEALLRREIGQLVRANRLRGDAVCRVSLSAPAATSPGRRPAPTRVILLRPLPADLARAQSRGIAARTFRRERATGPAAAIKATSYLPSLLALRDARRAGAREAIFIAPSGEVREGAASNVFARAGNGIVTPPADGRILPGIMRGLILALARSEGIPVRERTLRATELARAKEIFITNAVREIVPLVRLDGRRVGTGNPGQLTRSIAAAWKASLAGELDA